MSLFSPAHPFAPSFMTCVAAVLAIASGAGAVVDVSRSAANPLGGYQAVFLLSVAGVLGTGLFARLTPRGFLSVLSLPMAFAGFLLAITRGDGASVFEPGNLQGNLYFGSVILLSASLFVDSVSHRYYYSTSVAILLGALLFLCLRWSLPAASRTQVAMPDQCADAKRLKHEAELFVEVNRSMVLRVDGQP